MLNGRQLNGGDGSVNTQADTVNNNYNINTNYNSSLAFPTTYDFGVLSEILDYIFKQVTEIDAKKKNNSGSFTDIIKKIELNFNDEDERITIRESFRRTCVQKNLVEDFIARENEVNPMKVDALIDTVQSDYRKLKKSKSSRTPVESNEVIQDLAISYLPENKKRNPEYIANAKAIILYLFELCYFGKKTEEQQKTFDCYLNYPDL